MTTYSTSFEGSSDFTNNWTTYAGGGSVGRTAGNARTGSYKLAFQGASTDATATYSNTSITNITFYARYDGSVDGLPSPDYLRVDSYYGGSWHLEEEIYPPSISTSYQQYSVDTTSPASQIRFRATFSAADEFYYIDDVTITYTGTSLVYNPDVTITCSGGDVECRASRWDVSDYSVVFETWLKKSSLKVLKDSIKPGAVQELYKIFDRPFYYDQSWEGLNTITLTPNPYRRSLPYMRSPKTMFVKSISDSPLPGASGWINVKIEGYISGNSDL